MIVVDASVAAKWLLVEDQSAEAVELLTRRAAELVAPDILLPEVAGALVRRANTGEAGVDDALATLERWDQLILTESLTLRRLTPKLMLAAARLALSLRHPLKDCIYLALAIDLECPLATCDAKFVARVAGLYPVARLLRDFASDPAAGEK